MPPTNNQHEGSDALVHLRIPVAVKARWVRESRTAGAKLTDWIVQRVERQMTVFKVPESLSEKYHGAGYALAATAGGQLVDIVYLDLVLPEFDGSAAAAKAAINDPRLAPAVRGLQALGDVHLGMCSCWEFVEL